MLRRFQNLQFTASDAVNVQRNDLRVCRYTFICLLLDTQRKINSAVCALQMIECTRLPAQLHRMSARTHCVFRQCFLFFVAITYQLRMQIQTRNRQNYVAPKRPITYPNLFIWLAAVRAKRQQIIVEFNLMTVWHGFIFCCSSSFVLEHAEMFWVVGADR